MSFIDEAKSAEIGSPSISSQALQRANSLLENLLASAYRVPAAKKFSIRAGRFFPWNFIAELESRKLAGQLVKPDIDDRRCVKRESLAQQQPADDRNAQRMSQL